MRQCSTSKPALHASTHAFGELRTGLVTITQVTPTTQFIIKAVRSSEGLSSFRRERVIRESKHVTEKVIRRLKMMKAVLILVLGKFASVS